MAKKAKARRPASRKRSARKPTARVAGGLDKHTQQLHSFFHSLYKNPELRQQFSSGAEGRHKALAGAKLTDGHKALLKKGCVPEILHALVGSPAAPSNTMMVDTAGTLTCEHPECLAFSNATKG
jgi:hypothetical protein